MDIDHAIIHLVKKAVDIKGDDSVEIIPRDTLLPIDAKVTTLANDVLKLYTSLSNGYGCLGEADQYRFPNYLTAYTDAESGENFINLSKDTLKVIAEYMSKKTKTTTSYPLFIQYTNLGRKWILIAMLKLREGVGIDNATLDLKDTLSFDVHDLREAARIDVLKWENNEQPYLSFIKKGGGSSSSEYFRDALACTEYTDAKANTDNTIKAIDVYCEQNELDDEKRADMRAKMYEYCEEKRVANEPVNLTALSSRINDQAPESFRDFVKDNDIEINETFAPHKASYKQLNRLSRRFGTITVGFEVSDITLGRVDYDEDSNSLIIKVPKELVEEVKKASASNNKDEE